MKLALALLLLGSPLAAQRLDPDWNLRARDSRDHVLAGALVAIGARVVLPHARTWQRLAVCGTVALAYELGQEGVARSAGVSGPGYGIGVKDWLLTFAGGALVEWAWGELKR